MITKYNGDICVSLIDYTSNAVDKLIYTKNTRLTQGETTRHLIALMSEQEKQKELEYISNTIPSSWEFVNYTFEIRNVTRAFTHQFVRTRTGSYAQQTMRLLEKQNFTYRIPDKILEDQMAKYEYENAMLEIQKAYNKLLDLKIPAEDARGVLPTNIHTNIIAQFSLRTLAEMVKSRSGKRTQDEYRQIVDLMEQCVVHIHPWAAMFFKSNVMEDIKTVENFVENNLHDCKERYDLFKCLDKIRKSV